MHQSYLYSERKVKVWWKVTAVQVTLSRPDPREKGPTQVPERGNIGHINHALHILGVVTPSPHTPCVGNQDLRGKVLNTIRVAVESEVMLPGFFPSPVLGFSFPGLHCWGDNLLSVRILLRGKVSTKFRWDGIVRLLRRIFLMLIFYGHQEKLWNSNKRG